MQTSSLICNTCQLIGFYIIRIFIENNAQTEWFYPSGHMISIGHKWEVQMMSKMSWWFTSCIHGDVYFLMKFWMKNHCKWISQHVINNNNNDNNTNNNNNSNSAIVLQTWIDLLTQTYESFSKCVCCVIILKNLFWYILKRSTGENYHCQNLAENKFPLANCSRQILFLKEISSAKISFLWTAGDILYFMPPAPFYE